MPLQVVKYSLLSLQVDGDRSSDLALEAVTSVMASFRDPLFPFYLSHTETFKNAIFVLNLCYSSVTCKVFIESTSKLLNWPQRKLGQSCTNSWHKIDHNIMMCNQNYDAMGVTIQ